MSTGSVLKPVNQAPGLPCVRSLVSFHENPGLPTRLQSNTSNSVSQGIIILGIILSSMTSFICCMIQDLCQDSIKGYTEDCSIIIAILFPVANILVCVWIFVTYFLHVIAYCDPVSGTNKSRLILETTLTGILLVSLVFINIIAALTTRGLLQETTFIGVVSSGVTCVFFVTRFASLVKELVLLHANSLAFNGPKKIKHLTDLTPMTGRKNKKSPQKQRKKVKRSFSTFRSKFRRFSFTEQIDQEAMFV